MAANQQVSALGIGCGRVIQRSPSTDPAGRISTRAQASCARGHSALGGEAAPSWQYRTEGQVRPGWGEALMQQMAVVQADGLRQLIMAAREGDEAAWRAL